MIFFSHKKSTFIVILILILTKKRQMEFPENFQQWQEFFERFDNEMQNTSNYIKDKLELFQFAADELLKQNDYQGAKIFLEKALSLTKKINEPIAQARILNMLAQIFYAEQNLEDALAYIEKALEIFKKHKGSESPEVMDMYNNLAIILEAAGNFDHAVKMMLENIKRVKESKHFDELYLATSYNNLAGIFWSKQQPQNALEYLLKAKEIKEKKLEKDDPKLIELYNNLALIYLSLGNLSTAESYQKKSLNLIEKNNSPAHEKITALKNMALIYEEKGLIIEALDMINQAISLLKKVFPYGHPDIEEAEKIKEQWQKKL